ncbi:hypothetical protein [Amycolatopsis sp. NPDC004378]
MNPSLRRTADHTEADVLRGQVLAELRFAAAQCASWYTERERLIQQAIGLRVSRRQVTHVASLSHPAEERSSAPLPGPVGEPATSGLASR